MSSTAGLPFAEAAPWYKFRAPYAPAAIDYLEHAFGMDRASRVLDLGCGPGTLTIPFSRRAGQVVAVDPCQAMIDEGRRRAAQAGSANIGWHCSRAEDFRFADDGRFLLAVIGQAFHWMDRDAVLKNLAHALDPRGAVVLVNPGRRRPQESWEPTANEVIARYLGKPQRHADMHPEPQHEPALRRSRCFAAFSAQEFSTPLERDIPSIIGHTYSLSTSPRSAFGLRAQDFETELTQALLALNPSGLFRERVETEVMVARKRGHEGIRTASLLPQPLG